MIRRLVVAVIAIAVLAAIAVCAWVPIGGGPLESGGSAIGNPRQVGKPFTVAIISLRNPTRWTLEVRDVELPDDVPPSIQLLGVRVALVPINSTVEEGYPPKRFALRENVPQRKAVGAIVRPHADVPLLVGLRPTQTGSYLIRGVEVTYRVRVAGRVGPLFRRRVEPRVSLCVQREPLGPKYCDPPEAFPEDE